MKSKILQRSLFLLGLIATLAISVFLFKAPRPKAIDTASNQFSASRAFAYTKQIAQKPHSMGTEEHKRVRNYIFNELQNLGLNPSVQTTTSIDIKGGLSAGYVHNIIGRIKGIEGKKCVLIVGHYDSQPHTPGAADDGSAVASMLESARALQQNFKFQNDIVFLFTDGEEAGLFGATAFVNENPLKDSIGIVLNIEARGSSGVSITYEVSSENGWLMREYSKAVKLPFAHSIADEIYKLLPNDSDFTPFRDAGLSGFNIAFIDDFVNYHSMADTPENLSLRSLQHHGEYIMDIAKHFGNIDLSNTQSRDVVYFNWFGNSLVLYPLVLNLIFAITITLLLLVVIVIGIKRKRVSIPKILLSALFYIVSLALIIFFSWLFQLTIKSSYPHYENFYSSNFYNIKEYYVAFTCLSILIFSLLYNLLFKRINSENLLLGYLLVSFVMMFAFLRFIPIGAYLSIVPLLLILSGLLICYFFDFSLENKGWIYLTIIFLSLFPIITLFVPLIKILYITLGLKTIFGGVIVTSLLIGYFIIPFKIVYDWKKWVLPIIILGLFITKLVSSHLTSDYNKDRPLQSNVSYVYDLDSNNGAWFSSHHFMDEWKQQFFPNGELKPLTALYPNSKHKFLQNKADIYNIPTPVLMVFSDSIKEDIRKLEIVIGSVRMAQNCKVFINKNSNLVNFSLNGKNITDVGFYSDSSSNFYSFTYFGLCEKAITLNMSCKTTEKIEIIVHESKIGLPEYRDYKPMPDFIIPDKGFRSNVTIVKKRWEI